MEFNTSHSYQNINNVYFHVINIVFTYGKFNLTLYSNPKIYIFIYPSQWKQVRMIMKF
jgi:hypothetical protein